jgi:hypothetical protein
MEKIIKISDVTAVNPKHVVAVVFDKTTLKTKVVFPGMMSIESGKTFQETVDLLNMEDK